MARRPPVVFRMTFPLVSSPEPNPLPALHVEVRFGSGISGDAQGRALLALEKFLRVECGVPAQCFKQTMADDLKRRRDMTDEDRRRL